MVKIILASKSKVRKQILDKNNIESEVEPSNVDEDTAKKSLLLENAPPELISKNLAELKANKVRYSIFFSKAYSTANLAFFTPSLCPAFEGRFLLEAHLLFPSMITARWLRFFIFKFLKGLFLFSQEVSLSWLHSYR